MPYPELTSGMSYALAMQCPVLMLGMSYALAMQCLVLKGGISLPGGEGVSGKGASCTGLQLRDAPG
eukprot:3467466-Rhodomonas_salina.1